MHQDGGCISPEWPLIGDQFVKQDSEGPEVRTLVRVLAVILLRRHVGKRPDEHSGLGLGSFHHPRNAEVHDLDDAFLAEHHVSGLDVAVNNSALVGVVESATGLDGVRQLQGKRQIGPAADQLFQAFTLHQFHRYVGRACFFTHVINRNDIGMLQASRGLGFAVESLQHIGIFGHALGDGLERYQPIDNGVAGAINDSHRATAQLLDQFVFAELIHRVGTRPSKEQAFRQITEVGGRFRKVEPGCGGVSSIPTRDSQAFSLMNF